MVTDKRKCEISLPSYLAVALPLPVIAEAEELIKESAGGLEEIRLRLGKFSEYRTNGKSLRGRYIPDRTAMDEALFKLCGGSVYSHGDTLCKGYIRGEGGVRVGVIGHAVCRGEEITAIQNITSLNIRLPTKLHRLSGIGTPYPELAEAALNGLLICSPPGIGKTTALRYTARALAGRGHRVSVIDSRGELSFGLEAPGLTADILDGYPRGKGIEIAIRTLCPDIIVCDEIGNHEDCRALMSAVGAGVAVLATAHAASAEEVQRRSEIAELCRMRVFRQMAFLERQGSGRCKCTLGEVRDA